MIAVRELKKAVSGFWVLNSFLDRKRGVQTLGKKRDGVSAVLVNSVKDDVIPKGCET